MPNATEEQLLADSALHEIERDSLQELFRRVDDRIVLGLPEEIPESDLEEMVAIYTARRHSHLMEQDKKAAQGPRKRVTKAKIDLTLLDDL